MKKTDNRGLSLIELLVAVCILAVVAAPILHSFVTSYTVNAKGRTTLRATTLAQNEMEIFEREKLDDLLEKSSEFGYDLVAEPDETNPADPGCYTFSKLGVINDNSGRDMFDVYVTLDPERSGKYATANSTELFEMNTLSALDSGSYLQKVRTTRNPKSDDELVYEEYATFAYDNGHSDRKADYFEQNLKRTITLDIEQEDDGTGNMITRAKVTCLYECTDDSVAAAHKEKRVVTPIFDNTDSVDEEGERVELKSLYLFYAPRYYATNKDVIIVNNTAHLPVNVYVLRQDIWQKDVDVPDNANLVNESYSANLQINDILDADGRCAGTYYTNLKLDASEGNNPPMGGVTNLLINGSAVMAADRMAELESMGCLKLGSTGVKDRIYTMKVEVYKAGYTPGTDTPLATMKGSKLE